MQFKPSTRRQVRVRVIREPAFTRMTPRKREVCWDFGIPPREAPFTVVDDLTVDLTPGTIVLLSGPSGSGKSSILSEIAAQTEQACWVGQGRFTLNRPIVDATVPKGDLKTALEVLTACGLGEPRLWVRQYNDLSVGEKFRAGLARAVGQAVHRQQRTPIFCDEFTAILHRRAAKAMAFNLRKLVTRHRLILVVATAHEDIVEDLQPDRIIRLGGLQPEMIEQTPRERVMSLRKRAVIEAGGVRDYAHFASMHYRHRDGLGFVDKVFLMREGRAGPPLGILVFAHAPLELALRNHSTVGRFVRNPRRLNRELRILRRLVMHPDVRGCGLGHWFVKQALPQVGVRFVECLAAMGAINPVFEKAGMHRIGRCPLPRGRLAILQRLREWKLDPFAEDFPRKIARFPRLRALVEKTIRDWVAVAHGARQYDTSGKPHADLARSFRQLIGEPPMYYLWDREGKFPREPTEANAEKNDPAVRSSPRSRSADEPGRDPRERERHRP